ncbi:hypothetical protein F5141DRAFT_1066846 [Pisolithus sp. B1]|nr:hypothetical protein F5141DRAFT_1066846 [Pisolithus sp. B1]
MMDSDPLEPHLPIITALATIIGQSCLDLVTEEMSSDSTRAQWTDAEKSALISFLVEQKCTGKMGDGAFKLATLNTATAHLAQLFPNQRGPMKSGEHCVLRDINQWHNTSGVHWDNTNGANIVAATREEKEVFRSWLQLSNDRVDPQVLCIILKAADGPTLRPWRSSSRMTKHMVVRHTTLPLGPSPHMAPPLLVVLAFPLVLVVLVSLHPPVISVLGLEVPVVLL